MRRRRKNGEDGRERINSDVLNMLKTIRNEGVSKKEVLDLLDQVYGEEKHAEDK